MIPQDTDSTVMPDPRVANVDKNPYQTVSKMRVKGMMIEQNDRSINE